MFDKLKSLCERGLALKQDEILDEIFSVPSVQAQIVDLNQNQLYNQGVQSDGTPTGQYAPITVSKYKPLALAEGRDGRSDHITGKDTGETYASMKVQVLPKNGFEITADDRNNFFDRITDGLGLTEESVQTIMPEIKERMIDSIRQRLFT